VISASHNPPEYNGVKVFDREGHKLTDADELEIEALVGAPGPGGGSIEHAEDVVESYVDHVVEQFGSDLGGLRIAVDCANGAFSAIAPGVFERLGAEVTALAATPNGANINDGCGATDLAMLQAAVRAGGHDLGIAFDGDGDRMLAVDANGDVVDGDQIVGVLALDRNVELVAMTVMANMGLHRLMAENGIRVVTTDVGDRYVLEALRREGGILGGEQSGHLIWLDGHVTGDGLVAALLLCAALHGRPLAEVTSVLTRFPQRMENVAVANRRLTRAIGEEVARLNAELGDRGRVLVRPSGTEPVIRVLAEAETAQEAENLCGRIAALVRRELG
jgi:phosphoglucosamine mutase